MEITPSIVESLARDIYNKALGIIQEETGVTLERLCELAKADSEGLCTVLPCKVGSDVYEIRNVFDGKGVQRKIAKRKLDKFIVNGIGNAFFVSDGPYEIRYNLCQFGKSVFTSEEDAKIKLANKEAKP